MAAPEVLTTKNLTGRFIMNKSLSDPSDRILELQGVGWLKRKAIAFATITLDVKHYTDDDQVEHIDIEQTLTGGIKGTTENRTLDWHERSHDDHVFGPVIGKSRRITVNDIDDKFLRGDWLPDTIETGVIHSWVQSDTQKSGRTWTAEQIWGFQNVDGERRYARNAKFIYNNGEELHEIKLVYDYVSV